MKILGIGNDILELQRIRDAYARHGQHFFGRILTPLEQGYCLKYTDPVPHLAARFSAKEAIVKALGCGIGEKVSWHDIEIINDPQGKPEVRLSASLQDAFNNPKIFLSISHSDHYVSTMALCLEQNSG